MSKTNEYKIWASIIDRCSNPKSSGYYKYGARGITMCTRWRDDFTSFYADMGQRPSKKHSIDRIDNDGPYSPENCRWATNQEQQQNTRKSVYVDMDGERVTASEAARRSGLKITTIWERARKGWTGADLFRPTSRPSPRPSRPHSL